MPLPSVKLAYKTHLPSEWSLLPLAQYLGRAMRRAARSSKTGTSSPPGSTCSIASGLARARLDLVVALQPIDDHGDQPARGEEADDGTAERAEMPIDRRDGVPDRPMEAEALGDEAERLDAADGGGGHDRDEGDGQVVIELAQRLHEGPAIGAEYENAVGGVDQRHAGGEQRREDQDRPDRQPLGALGGGDAEDADLARRVEAQPEQETQRVHVPARADEAEERPEQAAEQPALRQEAVEVRLGIAPAALHPREGAIDRAQHEEVGERDGEEKQRRDAGADQRADRLDGGEPRLDRRRGAGDADRRQHDHGRMAEREVEAHRDRPPALLHELAGDVVDGGDVIGVDGMARAEAIGEHRRPQ